MDNKEVLGMECLPEELLEMVAGYLTAAELSNCCAVSVRWREMFGRDRLWRPHHNSALASYLETSQPVVQPTFLSPETPDSTLSAISPSRLCYMRERHLKNNWTCGNYKVEVTTNGFLNYFSRKITYNNDYILEFFDNKITVWDIMKTPSFHSSYPFHIEPNGGVNPVVIHESNKIVTIQCGVVRVFSLNLLTKELQMTLLFSVEMSEKCPDVSDSVLHALFKKHLKVSCTVLGNILVGMVYKDNETPPSLNVWNVENGQKLKEETCGISMNNQQFIKIEFASCYITRNTAIIYVFHNTIEDAKIRYYEVLSLSQLTVFPFLKSVINSDRDFNSSSHSDCAIFSHYIAIREGLKVCVYNYHTSELIYTSDSFGSICFWRNNIVFQNNHHSISVINISTKAILAQFEVEYLCPFVITNDAIFIDQNQEEVITFICRKEVNITSKNKTHIPLYSFQRGRTLFINKSCTKIVIRYGKNFIIVRFW